MQDRLSFVLATSQDVNNIFDQYLNQNILDQSIENAKNNIENQFNEIIEKLNNRKKELYENIEKWRADKIKEINQEQEDITKYQNDIKQIIDKKDDGTQILSNNDYKKYQKTDEILKYVAATCTSPDICFSSNVDMNKLGEYGKINSNADKSLFNPPTINLLPITKQEGEMGGDSMNGYKINLKFEISDNHQQNDKEFVIKYKQITKIDQDDDKKDAEQADNDELWEILKYDKQQLEVTNNKTFSISIMNVEFEFNKAYNFKIEHIVNNPYNLNIVSNTFQLSYDIDSAPKGDIIEIPLIYTSHFGDNNGPPSNLLKGDDSYYWSKRVFEFAKDQNDWIIFRLGGGNDINYFPLKFEIINHSGYQKHGVKDMNISIGNKENNEWYQYNEGQNELEIKLEDGIQIFDLKGVNSKVIKNRDLHWIKLQFTKNWGFRDEFGSKYAVKQIRFHGIKF